MESDGDFSDHEVFDPDDEAGEVEECESSDDSSSTILAMAMDHTTDEVTVSEMQSQDVLLPFELARLEGMEAVRIEHGADLVHPQTDGITRSLDLAARSINDRNPMQRPPYQIIRESARGTSCVHLRKARIAYQIEDYLPSD